MNRRAGGMLIAIPVLAIAASAAAQPVGVESKPKLTGIEVGLRVGYAAPMGAVRSSSFDGNTMDEKLSSLVRAQVPIRLDVGYRINPNIYVGAYFAYGLGLVSKDREQLCAQFGTDCAVHFVDFGIMGAYHILPSAMLDPWVGLGLGYETAQSSGIGFSGPTLFDLQAGVDYRATSSVSLGPFASYALGQYRTCSTPSNPLALSCEVGMKALHEWLTIGIKASYGMW